MTNLAQNCTGLLFYAYVGIHRVRSWSLTIKKKLKGYKQFKHTIGNEQVLKTIKTTKQSTSTEPKRRRLNKNRRNPRDTLWIGNPTLKSIQ